jgi:integrase
VGSKGRRGNGEHSVYRRRSDGRWCASAVLGWRDGKPARVTVYGRTAAEAREKLKAATARAESGLSPIPARITLKDFLTRWLDEVAKPSCTAKTHRTYSDLLRLHLHPSLLAAVPVSQLGPDQVQRWLLELAEKQVARGGTMIRLSASTVKACRDVLRSALATAMSWGLIARNPAALAKIKQPTRTRVETLSADEARAFLAAVEGHTFEALFVLALSLGLREGEVLGLQVQDIDLAAGRLHVRGQLQRIAGRLAVVEPKANSRRSLLLPEIAAAAVRAHLGRRAELARSDGFTDQGYLFCARTGSPIQARNLLREFYAIRARLGRPDLRFHDLRHTAATLLHAVGAPAKAIQQLMGHASDATTREVYMHQTADTETTAADLIDRLLLPRGGGGALQ